MLWLKTCALNRVFHLSILNSFNFFLVLVCVRQSRFIQRAQPALAAAAAADTPNFQLLSIRSRSLFLLQLLSGPRFSAASQSFEDARMYYNWPAEWLNASQLENSAARSSSGAVDEFFILHARDERLEI